MVAASYRALRSGGVMRILTPDLRALIDNVYHAREAKHIQWCADALNAGTPCEALNMHLRMNGDHRFVVDEEASSVHAPSHERRSPLHLRRRAAHESPATRRFPSASHVVESLEGKTAALPRPARLRTQSLPRGRKVDTMTIAVLFPYYDHPAIEERYASWQSELLLRADEVHRYDPHERARDAVDGIDAEHVLVITDPHLLPSPLLGPRLAAQLGGAFAVVPVSNEAEHPQQRIAAPAPYVTLREMQSTSDAIAHNANGIARVTWDASDPGAYLCRTSSLAGSKSLLRDAINGSEVAIASGIYIHRWSSMRGQPRLDLLDRIGTDAQSR